MPERQKTEERYDAIILDGYAWTDILDIFKIPHYTNDHPYSFDVVRQHEIRNVPLPSYDLDEPPNPTPVLVVWTGDRPTDEEIASLFKEDEPDNDS